MAYTFISHVSILSVWHDCPTARHSEGFTIDELQELTTVFMEQQSAPRHPMIQMVIRWWNGTAAQPFWQDNTRQCSKPKRGPFWNMPNLYGHLVCQSSDSDISTPFRRLFRRMQSQLMRGWSGKRGKASNTGSAVFCAFVCIISCWVSMWDDEHIWGFIEDIEASQTVCTKQICYNVRNICVII